MKKRQLLFFIGIFIFSFSTSTFSQKQGITDEEMVSETVTKEIDEVFKSNDFLKQKNKKFKETSGIIVFDIGVIQNGKISTLFKVDSDINNISFINFISDYIINYKFKFKLQKQQRYKVRYAITF